MVNLYIMVGCPGSGKSTYISEHMNLNNDRWVSRDQIRNNMRKKDDAYFEHEKAVYQEYIQRIQTNLNEGYNVWADATHLDERSRMKLLNHLTLTEVHVIFIQLIVPIDICLERNSHRTAAAFVPVKELKSMAERQTDVREDKRHSHTVITIYEGENNSDMDNF